MPVAKLIRLGWTTEDQTVYAKWRKSVVILYSALGLMIMSVWVGHLIAQPSLSALGWISFIFCTMAIALSLFVLLREAWKPGA
jgi:hypothetical protein